MPQNSTDPTLMIYGANGYSGRLIAAEALRRGWQPLLAGRNQAAVQALAVELGLAWRVFGLDSVQRVADALHDVDLVIHCAGPFSQTAAPMLAGCIEAQTHYLDITGEIAVFEQAKALGAQAQAAGITLCSGAGFDVIPTDCLAALLHQKMPDAVALDLGFAGGAALSPGTAKTSVEGMRQGPAVRVEGQIRHVPAGSLTRQIDFGRGPKLAAAIPWGDVSTAYSSTGIPNIRVFVPISAKTLKAMRLSRFLQPLIRLGVVQRFLKQKAGRQVTGPDAQTRAKLRMTVWGEVRNAEGRVLEARIETPNGYDLTSYGPLLLAERILTGPSAAGYRTPSQLLGADMLPQLPGVGDLHLAESVAEQAPA